jgi:F-type H+-transporting ATPase subunit delta
MMLDPVTNRYAEALFGMAKQQGALDQVCADVALLARELGVQAVGDFFIDARVPLTEKRSKMEILTTDMHLLTRNLIGLLFDKRREDVLPGFGAAFKRHWLADQGADEGVVESARPLGNTELASLADSLGKRLGKTLTLTNVVRPELLGGVRVIVGSQMLDSSIIGRLDGIKKRMQSAALPSLSEG